MSYRLFAEDRSKVDICEFDSFTDFVDQAERPASTAHSRSSRESGSTSWFGTPNFAAAVELARKGWAGGLTNISTMRSNFSGLVSKVRRQEIVYDVTGDTFDMGRVITGEPECFMTWTEDEATVEGPKIVDLVFSVSASSSISQAVITMRGAVICALIEALELSGRRVNLTMVWSLSDTRDIEIRVPIKRSSDPLQMDQVAFAAMHPSTLRRLFFSVLETLPHATAYGVGSGYGTPMDPILPGHLVFGRLLGSDSKFSTTASAIAWTKTTLKSFGVTFEDEV